MSLELITAFSIASWQTLIMVLAAGTATTLLGLPLGLYLFMTRRPDIWPKARFHKSCHFMINAWRSIPFIILLIAIIPLTRLLVGTSIGTAAAIVPLTLAATPFFARLIDNALQEVPTGLIEFGQAIGATGYQLIMKILFPEILPAFIKIIMMTLIHLVSYSAMAGVVGGGGLGDFAIQYGYQRFNIKIILITVIILIIFVQGLQMLGEWWIIRINHHNGDPQCDSS